MFVLTLAFVTATLSIALTSPVSVAQCGADPSGKGDSTQAFTSCLSAAPAGDVMVPAGIYRINGTIIKDRNHNLIGVGSKASILQCHAAYAPCIAAGDTTGGPNNYVESRVQDLTIEGPGVDNASIGVLLGGDPNGHFNSSTAYGDAVDFVSTRITGFNHGIEWGNNAWSNKIVRSQIFSNAIGIYAPTGLNNSGENLGVTDSSVFNNGDFGLDDHANLEWMISGTAFDYNGTAIEFFGSTLHLANCHIEQNSGRVMFQPYGNASVSIKDSEIIAQSSQGSDQYMLSTWPQVLILSLDNVSIWSNHPVEYFVKVQGMVSGTVTNLNGNGNKMIGKFSNLPSAVTFVGPHF